MDIAAELGGDLFWDDDMIAGSIHTIPYFEFMYRLKKTSYNGWISTKQYPYREDGKEVVAESIKWMKAFVDVVNRMDENLVENVIKSGDAVKRSQMLRKYIFDKAD